MKNETILGHVLTLMTIIIWGTTFRFRPRCSLRRSLPSKSCFSGSRSATSRCGPSIRERALAARCGRRCSSAAAGLCGVTLYFLLENIALTYTFASNVGVIISIAPFFTALMANWLLDGEPLRKRFFVGFAAALTGHRAHRLERQLRPQAQPRRDILARWRRWFGPATRSS